MLLLLFPPAGRRTWRGRRSGLDRHLTAAVIRPKGRFRNRARAPASCSPGVQSLPCIKAKPPSCAASPSSTAVQPTAWTFRSSSAVMLIYHTAQPGCTPIVASARRSRAGCIQACARFSKEVLFWKKEPKNFYPLRTPCTAVRREQMDKSLFASFSSEKEDLAPHSRYDGSIPSSRLSSAGHSSTPRRRMPVGLNNRLVSATASGDGICSSVLHDNAIT